MNDGIGSGFENSIVRLKIQDLQPLRLVTDKMKQSKKYTQILSSWPLVGLVENPVVAPVQGSKGKYLILDGHMRIEAIKSFGETEVDCLLSTEDESFTYNRKITRLAPVQEHKMILNAIERGVSEEKLARALNLNISSIREKRNLLQGICGEAVELLKDKQCPAKTFRLLKKVLPIRQVEAAELMVAMNNFSSGYAKAIIEVTPASQMITEGKKKSAVLSSDEIARMETELSKLHGAVKEVETTYGPNIIALVAIRGYIKKLIANQSVSDFLEAYHPDLRREFENIVNSASLISEESEIETMDLDGC